MFFPGAPSPHAGPLSQACTPKPFLSPLEAASALRTCMASACELPPPPMSPRSGTLSLATSNLSASCVPRSLLGGMNSRPARPGPKRLITFFYSSTLTCSLSPASMFPCLETPCLSLSPCGASPAGPLLFVGWLASPFLSPLRLPPCWILSRHGACESGMP